MTAIKYKKDLFSMTKEVEDFYRIYEKETSSPEIESKRVSNQMLALLVYKYLKQKYKDEFTKEEVKAYMENTIFCMYEMLKQKQNIKVFNFGKITLTPYTIAAYGMKFFTRSRLTIYFTTNFKKFVLQNIRLEESIHKEFYEKSLQKSILNFKYLKQLLLQEQEQEQEEDQKYVPFKD